MTVTSTKITAGPYAGNGVTDTFSYGFGIEDKSEITILETDDNGVQTTLTVDADYTVNNAGVQTGGTITRSAGPLPSNYEWYIRSNYEETQETDFESQGAFFPDIHEKAMDKLTRIIQQVRDTVTRSMRIPDEYSGPGTALLPEPKSGYLLRWLDNAFGFENVFPSDLTGVITLDSDLPKEFANVAAAVADTTLTLGKRVNTKWYSSVDDGGGASYVVVASGTGTADNGSFIDMTNGFQLQMIQDSELNILTYGLNADGVTDDYIQMQAALTAVKPNQVLLITRPIAISQKLTRSTSVQIRFSGEGRLVALNGFTGSIMLEITGTLTQIPDLSVDAIIGDSVVSFASSHGLEDNDVFIIYNPTDYSWSGYRPVYKAGEFCRVHSSSGNNINVWGELYDSYVVADVDIYKVNPVNVIITNPTFEGNDVDAIIGCRITLGVDVTVTNPVTLKTDITGIEFDRCYGVLVDSSSIKVNAAAAGNQYGIIFSNCHDFKLHGSLYATRHCVGIGGGSSVGAVTNRLGRISNSNLYGLKSTGVPTGDMHGNVEDIWYSDCIFRNGVQLAGKNVGLKSCTIYGVGSSGACVLGSEVIGGFHTLDSCELITNVSTASRGVVYLAIDADTVEPLKLIARNNTFKVTNQPATWVCFYIDNNGSTASVSAIVDGAQAFSNIEGVILRVEKLAGSASTDGFIVDNVYCDKSGTWLMFPDGDYHLLPLRLQRQSGVAQVTTVATSESAIAPAQVFRYIYPRIPESSVTVRGRDGAAQGIVGNYAAVPLSFRSSNTQVEPAIITYNGVAKWGAIADVDILWSAELSEI